MAAASRVVVSTVGPYLQHGEPLVAACAAAGTDYLDLTGEPEFVDRMYAGYHQQALRTGARLIHCCGFDSIPHDLGVLFTVGLLPDDVPITVEGVRAGRRPAVGGHASTRRHRAVPGPRSRPRRPGPAGRLEPRPADRRARAVRTRPRREGELWLLPLPTIDPQVVARSGRALPRYGPDFQLLPLRRRAQAAGRGGRRARPRGAGRAGPAATGPPAAAEPFPARHRADGRAAGRWLVPDALHRHRRWPAGW